MHIILQQRSVDGKIPHVGGLCRPPHLKDIEGFVPSTLKPLVHEAVGGRLQPSTKEVWDWSEGPAKRGKAGWKSLLFEGHGWMRKGSKHSSWVGRFQASMLEAMLDGLSSDAGHLRCPAWSSLREFGERLPRHSFPNAKADRSTGPAGSARTPACAARSRRQHTRHCPHSQWAFLTP